MSADNTPQQVTLPKFDLGGFIRFTDKNDPIIKDLVSGLAYSGKRKDVQEREYANGRAYTTFVTVVIKKAQATIGQLTFTLTHEFEFYEVVRRTLVITTNNLANINFRPVTITKVDGVHKIRREASDTAPAQKLNIKRNKKRDRITAKGTATYMGVAGVAKMSDGGLVTKHMIRFKTEKTKILMSVNANSNETKFRKMQLHSQHNSAVEQFTRSNKGDDWKLVGKGYSINGRAVDEAQMLRDDSKKRNESIHYIE